jgi:hypothetical protein
MREAATDTDAAEDEGRASTAAITLSCGGFECNRAGGTVLAAEADGAKCGDCVADSAA